MNLYREILRDRRQTLKGYLWELHLRNYGGETKGGKRSTSQ